MDITWMVQYNDGSQRLSSDDFKYGDIDRERLEVFALLQVNNMKPLVVLHLTPERRLIYRKRSALDMNVRSGEITGRKTVWLAGWQQIVAGKNVQVLTALFEDGHVEITNGFKEGHPWFDNVNFLPEELLEK